MQIVAEQSVKATILAVVAVLQNKYRDLELKAKAETADTFKLSSNVEMGARKSAPQPDFANAM